MPFVSPSATRCIMPPNNSEEVRSSSGFPSLIAMLVIYKWLKGQRNALCLWKWKNVLQSSHNSYQSNTTHSIRSDALLWDSGSIVNTFWRFAVLSWCRVILSRNKHERNDHSVVQLHVNTVICAAKLRDLSIKKMIRSSSNWKFEPFFQLLFLLANSRSPGWELLLPPQYGAHKTRE